MVAILKKKNKLANFPFYKSLEESETIVVDGDSPSILLADELKNCTIRLKEGAKLTFIFIGHEGWEETRKIQFELAGRESELLFLGLMVGREKEKFPFETISKHLVPQTKAHYYLRAAMFDHSLVDYKGNIIIEKEAQLSDSYLAHHTLLLSDYARARTIPALEIEADDVKAGHAATIGKVDEEVMFYLQSRGINVKEAELMLIEGFFEPELKMIENEDLQKSLREILQQLLSLHTIL